MDFFNIPFFDVVRSRMRWLEQRQDTIAENIANSSTPNYKARDLKEIDFAKLLTQQNLSPSPVREGSLRATHANHLQGTMHPASSFKVIDAPDREVSPDGNSVTLEDQMMKLAETQMEHETATGLYRKAMEMLRIAVRGQ